MQPRLSCQFEIVSTNASAIVLKDTGYHHKSLTNDAEAVVEYLIRNCLLAPSQQLFYIDSEGNKDEILFDANGFKGFKILRDNEAKSEPAVVAERPLH